MFPPQGIGVSARRSNTVIIAAHDSIDKSRADYVCDGIDDQETINSAISAISSTGGTVLLLEGTYIITGSINLVSNIALVGQGSGTLIKVPDILNIDELPVIYGYNVSRVLIANLRIDGNKANQTDVFEYGIYFDTVTYSEIRDCRIENIFLGPGIFLADSNNNIIIGNVCQGCECCGILLGDAVVGYSSNDNIIVGNVCRGNGEGIRLENSNDNIVIGNICQENPIGIDILKSNNNTIEGNICLDIRFHGISIVYLNGPSSNNTVVGNICQRCGNNGIFVYSSHNNVVTGNVCKENSFSGIYVAGSNNTVTDNVCQDNGGNGIHLHNSNNNLVVGNEIKGNGGHGIYIAVYSRNNNITGNYILGNSQASDNAYDGIYLYNGSNYNFISSNLIRRGDTTNQQRYGIFVDSGCESNVIHGNDLYQAGKTADFYDGGTGTIYHNNRTTQGWVP
jgi:parallel beta-helix repeat protein